MMWSHYTGDGSGFVIAYDVEGLRDLCLAEDYLRPLDYSTKPPFIMGYPVLSDASNILIFLARKSYHWEYEQEWRLIVELNATIGTGHRDARDQPINLVRIPNRPVSKVFFTERTPAKAVDEVRKRSTETAATAPGISPSLFSPRRSTPTWKRMKPSKPDCCAVPANPDH